MITRPMNYLLLLCLVEVLLLHEHRITVKTITPINIASRPPAALPAINGILIIPMVGSSESPAVGTMLCVTILVEIGIGFV